MSWDLRQCKLWKTKRAILGDDSRTKPRCKKQILILNQDAINDSNSKSKC
jgi:hypothetical protein